MSSPLDVVKLLQDALDTQPTIVGQPNDNNLLALKEKLLDIFQTITYDRADGVHHLVGMIQSNTAYKVDHNGVLFPIPQHLGLWDDKITEDTERIQS
jgi:hypothetical protein